MFLDVQGHQKFTFQDSPSWEVTSGCLLTRKRNKPRKREEHENQALVVESGTWWQCMAYPAGQMGEGQELQESLRRMQPKERLPCRNRGEETCRLGSLGSELVVSTQKTTQGKTVINSREGRVCLKGKEIMVNPLTQPWVMVDVWDRYTDKMCNHIFFKLKEL